VRSALANVDGVDHVKVNFNAKTVSVFCEDDSSTEAMVEALAAAGFGATIVE